MNIFQDEGIVVTKKIGTVVDRTTEWKEAHEIAVGSGFQGTPEDYALKHGITLYSVQFENDSAAIIPTTVVNRSGQTGPLRPGQKVEAVYVHGGAAGIKTVVSAKILAPERNPQ